MNKIELKSNGHSRVRFPADKGKKKGVHGTSDTQDFHYLLPTECAQEFE